MPSEKPVCPHCRAPLTDRIEGQSLEDVHCPSCGRALVEVPAPSGVAPKKSPSAREYITAGAALAVIALAVVWISQNLPEELRPDPEAAAAAQPRPDLGPRDEMAIRSQLVIHRSGAVGGERPIVALGSPAGPHEVVHPAKRTYQGLLGRELVRQAVLMAARDELGLATRDAVIGEETPAGPVDTSAEVITVFKPGSFARVFLTRGGGEQPEILIEFVLLKSFTEDGSPTRLVAAVEVLSRSVLPDAFRKLGLGRRTPEGAGATGPAEPRGEDDRLDRLSFIPPFAAIREAHAAVRARGESPQRLGALVRGYALLGALTEYHWSPAHKAYAARSLLYAQRIVARDPKSPWGLWHRAYAEAFAGLHREALADLDAAGKLPATATAQGRPDWVDLIGAYCRYDTEAPAGEVGPRAPLAALLRMRAVEFPDGSALALRAARAVVALDPECFLAVDLTFWAAGATEQDVVSVSGPKTLATVTPRSLGKVADLPEPVRARLGDGDDGAALTEALARAGDPANDAGEPSWGALGQFLEETQFIHVLRRLTLLTHLGSPKGEFWAEAEPLVEDHPYHGYLEIRAGSNVFEGGRMLKELSSRIDGTDLQVNEMPMIRSLERTSSSRGGVHFAFVLDHVDPAARDLALATGAVTAGNEDVSAQRKAEMARRLLAVSPHSPYAMSVLVDNDWDRVRPQLPGWLRDAGATPAMLGAMARHEFAAGRTAQARDHLTRYVRLSPDRWAFDLLARSYRVEGKPEAWKATLDEFLAKGEDHSFDRAATQVAIADDYMAARKWDQARPYAEAAAATGRSWAMICAHRCAVGREEWAEAERWARQLSQRYPDDLWPAWYIDCKWNGRGDVEEARALCEWYIGLFEGSPRFAEEFGQFYLLSDEPRKAFDRFESVSRERISGYATFQLVLSAAEVGRSDVRDKTLELICRDYKAKEPGLTRLFEMYRDMLARGDEGRLDLEAVDRLIAKESPKSRGRLELATARILATRGDRENAAVHLNRCVDSPDPDRWARVIARDMLRRWGLYKDPGVTNP